MGLAGSNEGLVSFVEASGDEQDFGRLRAGSASSLDAVLGGAG